MKSEDNPLAPFLSLYRGLLGGIPLVSLGNGKPLFLLTHATALLLCLIPPPFMISVAGSLRAAVFWGSISILWCAQQGPFPAELSCQLAGYLN